MEQDNSRLFYWIKKDFVIDRYVDKLDYRIILIKLDGNRSKFRELKEESLKLLFSFAVNQELFSSRVIA